MTPCARFAVAGATPYHTHSAGASYLGAGSRDGLLHSPSPPTQVVAADEATPSPAAAPTRSVRPMRQSSGLADYDGHGSMPAGAGGAASQRPSPGAPVKRRRRRGSGSSLPASDASTASTPIQAPHQAHGRGGGSHGAADCGASSAAASRRRRVDPMPPPAEQVMPPLPTVGEADEGTARGRPPVRRRRTKGSRWGPPVAATAAPARPHGWSGLAAPAALAAPGVSHTAAAVATAGATAAVASHRGAFPASSAPPANPLGADGRGGTVLGGATACHGWGRPDVGRVAAGSRWGEGASEPLRWHSTPAAPRPSGRGVSGEGHPAPQWPRGAEGQGTRPTPVHWAGDGGRGPYRPPDHSRWYRSSGQSEHP